MFPKGFLDTANAIALYPRFPMGALEEQCGCHYVPQPSCVEYHRASSHPNPYGHSPYVVTPDSPASVKAACVPGESQGQPKKKAKPLVW